MILQECGTQAVGENWRDCYRTPEHFLVAARELWPSANVYDPFPANWGPGSGQDGFTDPWAGYAWVNPPFSRYREAARHGLAQPTEQLWICRTDNSTEWFQKLLGACSGFCLLYQRVRFIDPLTGEQTKGTDRVGNTIFYRGNDPEGFAKAFQNYGIFSRRLY